MIARSNIRTAAALALSAWLLVLPAVGTAQTSAGGAARVQATLEAPVESAPVVVDGVPLFRIRGGLGFPAEARAKVIAERIETVADDASFDPSTLRLVPEGEFIGVFAGPLRILDVTPPDAQLDQLTTGTLAAIVERRIRLAIGEYREARTPEHLASSTIGAGGATLVFVLGVAGLIWLSRRLRARVQREIDSRMQTVGIQSFEILRAERVSAVVLAVMRVVVITGVLALTLYWLKYALGLFPWTRGFAIALLRNTVTPLAGLWDALLGAIPNLIFLAILYYVLRGMLRLIRSFFVAVQRESVTLANFEPEWAMPTYNLVRLAIIGLGLVVAYPYIPGSGSDAFKGVSIFAGIVFSLGSSTAIANMMAGYMMTYRRAFRIGDRVKIGDVTGDVTEMRLQVTHLRTPKNEEVVIPNSQIINGHVTNYSTLAKENGLLLHTTVGIGYETPWRQVEAMLLEAASRTSGLATEPAPFVLQTALGDYAITYEINVGCDDAQRMAQLYSALHRNILDVFNEYGVAIMTPSYVADPPDAKLVPKGNWFPPPASQDRA